MSIKKGNMDGKKFYIFDSQTGEMLSKIYSSVEERDVKAIQMEIEKLMIEIINKYC